MADYTLSMEVREFDEDLQKHTVRQKEVIREEKSKKAYLSTLGSSHI